LRQVDDVGWRSSELVSKLHRRPRNVKDVTKRCFRRAGPGPRRNE